MWWINNQQNVTGNEWYKIDNEWNESICEETMRVHKDGLRVGYKKGYHDGFEDGLKQAKKYYSPAIAQGLRSGSSKCGVVMNGWRFNISH